MLSNDPAARQRMIELALKEMAPKTYLQLKMQGKLQKFLEDHDAAMMEDYDPMRVSGEAVDAAESQGYEKQVQAGYRAIALHDEQTLATWLDFSDPPTTESDNEI